MLIITIIDSVVVCKHPSLKVAIELPLNLDMDKHPHRIAILLAHTHQLISKATPKFGIMHHLLKLGVEKFMTFQPVDIGMDRWKEEGEKICERVLDRFFPWAIIAC